MVLSSISGRGARALVWAAAVAMVGLGSCERAAERSAAANSGWQEFEGSWNASGMRRSIPLGDGREGAIIDLGGTMMLTGEGRPGVGFRAEMIALVDSATGVVGRAVWTNERGDQVFCEITGEGTREDNRISGTFVGGTGRFGAVSGTFEFSWRFVLESEDGAIQGRAAGLKGRFRVDGAGAGGKQ